jgi:hypothetical protein
MDDPPTDVESLEQLNEWRINHRKLGPREFARVLKDGIFLCKYVTQWRNYYGLGPGEPGGPTPMGQMGAPRLRL